MKELIQLKNKIHINLRKENKNKDQLQIKYEKLMFFKESISNLEMIYNSIKALQTKGIILPILIKIKLEYPNKNIFLNKIETNFEIIIDFLFKVKTELILQLDLKYKQNIYLRFLYGKLFNKINKHLNGGDCAYDILRYILNKIYNKEDIINGEVINQKKTYNFKEEYKLYTDNLFMNISHFINSLFEKNGTSLQKHYEKMLIKTSNKYKGFYLHKCENGESMEEFIINIFLEKIGHLPLAQNILIMNKEVSPEEIRAFFYRAILCDYNTLFVVEIDDSLSNYQQNIMYDIINPILSYKNKLFNESKIRAIDMEKTYIYLKSCIVIIYNDNIKDDSFLFNLEKLNVQEIGNLRRLKENKFENITVITSDICGLGKSHKIKKMIKLNNKRYYHFLLGGILTKAIICEKLSSILKKIKEKDEDYEKVSIHLDLKESKEISLINEFLFSFLITKFYIYNENIIYIPKDIQIYIEIPNCFEKYLSKFGILKIFNYQNISLDNIPNLDLPKDIINTFSLMLGYDSNEKIEKFIKENIGIKNYSYYQIIIFIELFISQLGKFGTKLKFISNSKDVTEEFIQQFAKSIKYFIYGGFIKMITEINAYKNKKIIDLLSNIYEYDIKNFDIPLIFINEEKKLSTYVKIQDKNSNEFKSSEYYLSPIKNALDIQNDIKKEDGDKKSLKSILNYKTDNFVITEDCFRKMILLVYRIKANIPTIIMGETGCGKTFLVIKLNQILNNGEIKVRIIKIHPNITEKDICKEMKKINEESKHIKDDIWILFDEMNTYQSLSLLTEIFINRTYNGEKINKNIRLIGACTPYRKKKISTEIFELNRGYNNEYELVYLVQPLPQSLLHFVFNFGLIDEEDERKYIYKMIEKLFSKEEIKLHEITIDSILECHKFLRKRFGPSIVSLRDISRFYKIVKFFQKYFSIKDEYLNKDIKGKEKLYKIKSIICSIYICYFIRLNDFCIRANFEHILMKILLKLVNAENVNEEDENCCSLFDQIKYKELKEDLKEQRFINFSDFLELEEEFLLDVMELDKGIGKNILLKESVFLLFISVITKIPLIIIGKPGTGKSLSAQLIYKSFKGKYSKNKFFRKFPPIIPTYFQGSELTNPEDVEKLFEIGENKYKYYIDKKIKREDLPISMILFDHLELAEKSETNPLMILPSKLDNAINEGISFIGISNYSLDAANINRALILSVQNLEERLDDLKETSKAIAESISENLIKNQKQVLDILTRSYYEYKCTLKFLKELTVLKAFSLINKESKDPIDLRQKDFEEIKAMKEYCKLYKNEEKIKLDFHDIRNFYNFIKDIAIESEKLGYFEDNTIINIIENSIERNFGGIDYEIDIYFQLILDDIKDRIDDVKNIFQNFFNFQKGKRKQDENDKNNGKIKFSSVFLYKKVYNLSCEIKSQYQYKITNENCEKYDIYKCINDNIYDTNNSRYLLLEINPVFSSLICQIIKNQNPDRTIEFYDGSPFIDNKNKEYYFKILNKIQNESQTDKIIIIYNLNQIHPFLYDLCNMNYIVKDGQKYSKIIFGNFNEQLIPVHDLFKIIILVDRKFMDESDFGFLSRFEKIKITLDQLLDNKTKILAKRVIEETNLNYYIEQRKINYELKDLLINYGEEEIGSMIYNIYINYKKEGKEIKEKEIEEEVYSKIAKMLCQDIIFILPDDNIIKKIYLNKKKYYNLEKYITDNANKNYKISIIYTFNSITNDIKGANNEMKFGISYIKSEDELKYMIDKIINLDENNKISKEHNIMIQFEQINVNKVQFIINFIDKYYREEKYEKYKFIFIIHIKRNFSFQNNNRINLIPELSQSVNQLFIDNLNAADINLEDLMEKDIKSLIEENDNYIDFLNKVFNKSLIKFVNNNNNDDNYCLNPEEKTIMDDGNYMYEIENYMNKDKDFKNDIIKKVKKLINNDEEEFPNCKSLIDKLIQMNYIDKNCLDIISCILDYIGDEIFSKYFEYIFKVLEDNNILTTLKDIKNSKDNILNENILNKIKKNALDKIDKINYKPKFLSNFKIPGFYNFYKNLSTFINKNISKEYSKNESILRENKSINEKEIKDFHEKEEVLVSSAYDEISNDKFIFDIIDEIPYDVIIKDYINYYVNKYRNISSQGDFNKNLIEILLNLRFNEHKNKVIKNNKIEYIKIIIKEIIWMEANFNYISNIVKLFEYSKDIFNHGNRLYNKFEEKITDKNNIRNIIDENKEYISEVNECYYIFLRCFCLCIPSDEISLTKSLNLENNEKNIGQENKDKINKYIELLKKINIILKELNNILKVNITEISIIDKIIEIIKNKDRLEDKDKKIKKYERKGDSDSESSKMKDEDYDDESSSKDIKKNKKKDESSDDSNSYEFSRKRRRKESSSSKTSHYESSNNNDENLDEDDDNN